MGYGYYYYGSWNHEEFRGEFETYEDMIQDMISLKEDDESGAEGNIDHILSYRDDPEDGDIGHLISSVYEITMKSIPFIDGKKVIDGWEKQQEENTKKYRKQQELQERDQYKRLKEKYEEKE
jgi:hypothetical protein